MKFALFCCVVWITLYSFYLEQNGADGMPGVCKTSPEKKIIKGLKALQKHLEKYCENSPDPECVEILKLANGIPERYRKELVNNYLDEKRASKTKSPTDKLRVAKDALCGIIFNNLDTLLRNMRFRELKFYNLRFDTLLDLFKSFYDDSVINKDLKLMDRIDEAYNELAKGAGTDEKAFLRNLNPDEDVKVGLALYFLNLRDQYSGEDLTRNVIQSYKDEVIKLSEESLPDKDRYIVEVISKGDENFFQAAAHKESLVTPRDVAGLGDVERRNTIYKAFVKSYAKGFFDAYCSKPSYTTNNAESIIASKCRAVFGFDKPTYYRGQI